MELRSVVTAVETLHAAEKYLCQGLVKECVHYLASQLNTENVLQIFQRTRLYVPTDDPAQPSAPPLDVIDRSPSIDSLSAQQQQQEHEFRQLQQQQQLEQQQQRMSWCSYLINQCLEFIDKNASGVLASEVILGYTLTFRVREAGRSGPPGSGESCPVDTSDA